MSSEQEIILELFNTLASLNCPLVVRSDDWWIEELLFKPGKPRTDLIAWIVSRSLGGYFCLDLDSTNASSASSSNRKLPESDEAIFDFLRETGICADKVLPFVKGTLPKEEQTEYWYLLIDSFHYSLKPNTNTNITFGCGNLSNVVSMENFLDIYSMKASLLPADLQSEIEHVLKIKPTTQFSSKENAPVRRNVLNDQLLLQNFSEQAARLNSCVDQFVSIFKSDLEVNLPKLESSYSLLEAGPEIDSISTKCIGYKKNLDSLVELRQSSIANVNNRKVENLLKRLQKDRSFEPFRNMIEKSFCEQ